MIKSAISVIIPVYNVEKHLEKCVKSVLNQTFKDYRIILVDDGSTDSSGAKCDDLAKNHPQIEVYHKENSGLSDARNYGIDHSDSEYVTFIDSDDFIAKHYLEYLYNSIRENNADIAISSHINVYENNIPEVEGVVHESYIISREEAYKRMLLQNGMDVGACSKIYKRKVFESVKFTGKIYEDIITLPRIMELCETIVYLNYCGYCYLQRGGSIMHRPASEDTLVLIDAAKYLMDLMEEKYPSAYEAAFSRYIYCSFHVLSKVVLNSNMIDDAKNIRKKILSKRNEILHLKIIKKKIKAATIILSFGLTPYKIFWKGFSAIKMIKTRRI